MAKHDIGEAMLCRGWPQQKGIEHHGMARALKRPIEQLDELRVIDNFRPFGVGKERPQRRNHFALGVAPCKARDARPGG